MLLLQKWEVLLACGDEDEDQHQYCDSNQYEDSNLHPDDDAVQYCHAGSAADNP